MFSHIPDEIQKRKTFEPIVVIYHFSGIASAKVKGNLSN